MNMVEWRRQWYHEWKDTPSGKRSKTISTWKKRGLIADNYDIIYYRWFNSSNCENCGCIYNDGYINRKCMDHDHITGKFRNILCNACNVSKDRRN